MKKHAKLLFIPIFILGIVALTLTLNGCKKGIVAPTCSPTDDGCGGEIQTCCTSVQCYYTYNGKKYNCDGTDCTDAAQKVVADIDCYSVDLNSVTIGNSIQELLEVVEMLKEANLPCDEEL